MPRTLRTLTVIAAALTIAACGKTNGVETTTVLDTLPPTPNCADVFHHGQPVTELDNTYPTCTDPHGQQHELPTWPCTNGTRIVNVDKHTGAPQDGWYQTGGIYHADPNYLTPNSPYAQALHDCTGN